MKNMKFKIILLPIIVVLLLGFILCSCDHNALKNDTINSSKTPPVSEQENPTPEETDNSDSSDPENTELPVNPTTPHPPTSPTDPDTPSEPTVPTAPEAPTDPQENPIETDPTNPENPEQTDPMPSEPNETDPPASNKITYLEYYQMSSEQQQAFINSFESIEAFFAWHNAAKEEYEESWTPIDGSTPFIP